MHLNTLIVKWERAYYKSVCDECGANRKDIRKEQGGTYHTTPQSTTGVSPSKQLQGRRTHTQLDMLKLSVTKRVEQHQMQQKLSHDSTAHRMYFSKRETVYAQNFVTGQKWMPTIVQYVTGSISFLVKLQDGRLIRCHQDHLRHWVADTDTEALSQTATIIIKLFVHIHS